LSSSRRLKKGAFSHWKSKGHKNPSEAVRPQPKTIATIQQSETKKYEAGKLVAAAWEEYKQELKRENSKENILLFEGEKVECPFLSPPFSPL